MKPIVTWVLLMDNRHARILANKGQGTGLVQLPDHAHDAPEIPAYSDDEGRNMRSQTKARTRLDNHVEQSPESLEFARDIVAVLELAQRRGEFDRLVISAAPRTLGSLRDLWPHDVKETILSELDKDLVHVPIDKLPTHFDDILRL